MRRFSWISSALVLLAASIACEKLTTRTVRQALGVGRITVTVTDAATSGPPSESLLVNLFHNDAVIRSTQVDSTNNVATFTDLELGVHAISVVPLFRDGSVYATDTSASVELTDASPEASVALAAHRNSIVSASILSAPDAGQAIESGPGSLSLPDHYFYGVGVEYRTHQFVDGSLITQTEAAGGRFGRSSLPFRALEDASFQTAWQSSAIYPLADSELTKDLEGLVVPSTPSDFGGPFTSLSVSFTSGGVPLSSIYILELDVWYFHNGAGGLFNLNSAAQSLLTGQAGRINGFANNEEGTLSLRGDPDGTRETERDNLMAAVLSDSRPVVLLTSYPEILFNLTPPSTSLPLVLSSLPRSVLVLGALVTQTPEAFKMALDNYTAELLRDPDIRDYDYMNAQERIVRQNAIQRFLVVDLNTQTAVQFAL